MRIKKSLAYPIILLLILVAFSTLYLGYNLNIHDLRETLEAREADKAKTTYFFINSKIEGQVSELGTLARVLRENEELAAGLAHYYRTDGDVRPLQQTMERLYSQVRSDFGLFLVTDLKGTVVYCADSPEKTGESQDMIWGMDEARHGEEVTTAFQGPEGWALMVLEPVFRAHKLYGVLILGLKITDKFAETTAHQTQTEISFASLTRVLASSLPPDSRNQLDLAAVRSSILEKRSLFFTDYQRNQSSLYIPLKVADETLDLIITGNITNIAELLQQKKGHLITSLIVIFCLVTALGSGLTYGIIRPLRRLQGQSLRLIKEFRGEDPVLQAGGNEIQILSQVFQALAVTINNYINGLRQAKEALFESEKRFRDITENASEWVWEVDDQGRLTYCSPVVEKILGYEPEEILTRHFFDLFPPEEAEKLTEAALEIFAAMRPFREVINRVVKKNGEIAWVSTSGVPLLDSAGNLLGYRGANLDITARRQAEAALGNSEEKYRLLVSQIPAVVFKGYGDWSVDFFDKKVEALTGYAKEDFDSRRVKWCDLIPQEDFDYAQGVFIEALKGDKAYVREHRLRRKDGEIIWVQCRGQIFCDAQGKVDYISGVSFDITARKRAEEALRESEKRFRDLAENAQAWIWEVDAEGRYTYASPVVEKLLGYQPQEILGKHFYDLFHPEEREELKKAALAAFAARQPFREFSNRNLHKNGEVVWLSTSGVPILDDRGHLLGYRGADIDITERLRAERALRDNERFLASIFESIQDGISILDRDYNILRVNPAMQRIFAHTMPLLGSKCYQAYHGRTEPCEVCPARQTLATGEAARETLVEKSPGGEPVRYLDLHSFPLIDRETAMMKGVVVYVRDITSQKLADEALRESQERFRLLAENSEDIIWTMDQNLRFTYLSPAFHRISGYTEEESQNIALEQILTPASMELARKTLAGLLASENEGKKEAPRSVREEVDLIRKDGSTVSFEAAASLLRDSQGRPLGFMGIARDVTARKQLEEQLRQAVKMEAVGRLAGGVAHDFNNILTAITGYGELLLMNLDAKEPACRDVADILHAADRAASLTRQLLAFSRKQVLRPQALNLNLTVATLDKMLRRIIGEDIDLVTILHPQPCLVQTDPGQMEQVIMNLAVNARDAMPQGGKLTLETAPVFLGDDYVRRHAEIQPGAYVMLAISDTGAGMDAEAQARIFEPFFTTKELGKGTGLGLSTVYGIVRQSGGFIWVYSEPGQGTTFKIYLPRLDEEADKAILAPVCETISRGSETILLVEDEPLVRQVTQRILERQGYLILTAADGQEALRLSEQHPDPIHLVLTDVVMPGMSGHELMQRLRARHPEAKALYMSGYTENAIVHHGVLEAGIAFIQKPFKQEMLLQRVRDTLERA